ncbi:MAG: ribose 5-phosphate isomerase B [Clostridia bacterium]|nr:ribose 5-phosphate isomerase B [Clostridia bacterium]
MIVIGSDHGGYRLKEVLKAHLTSQNISFLDVGCTGEACDYPDIAAKAVQKILDGTCSEGILCCGTGIGISIAANRYPGIRAAVVSDPLAATLTKQHNNANILCMGGRMIGEEMGKACVDAWLHASFAGGRHAIRIDKLEKERTL